MPKTADSGSSSSRSTTSGSRETDESIKNLRAIVVGRKVALHGFDIETPDPIIRELHALLKASITNFLTNWYGLQVVPLGTRTNIIISNEADPATISKLARQASLTHRNSPTILVLCSQSARFDRNTSPSDTKCKIGYVAKPVGPLKLAKAIAQCIDGAPPLLLTPGPLDPPYHSPGLATSSDLTNVFEELSVSAHRGELLDNSRMAADSDNARKAIESPTPNALPDKNIEFPFPLLDPRPKGQSMPEIKEGLAPVAGTSNPTAAALVTLATIGNPADASVSHPAGITNVNLPTERLHAPSMLLVDDNKINLKLLNTYMRKKKYPIIDEAENGLEAVHKFASREEGYDIIFMDISMPILNGFDATQQIRTIEKSRRLKEAARNAKLSDLSSLQAIDDGGKLGSSEGGGNSNLSAAGGKGFGGAGRQPSLVIALTGLASGRDQQEAASVGIDIFLTKPVSFKEVGKLLDNWEANRERNPGTYAS